ncbi:unnamed protein product [Fusarium graminearum]|uniref:Chromosome 3, complete genome n=1 Tax=Gibberella zeae (strain ATCC MYA-4620 / CBS 123657 / FGSC 9075 / NRRL 31084 / PH-1) TaxID=229533 RepID=A0A0E0SNQ4_GIBZE|nr:hypothetical protein FG05_30055 [Fusarium graminearum]CEF88067.1 unnamed protein product [Fusarium graminearum]CZS84968.1 unnamed protein product [Fusarium graminearum]
MVCKTLLAKGVIVGMDRQSNHGMQGFIAQMHPQPEDLRITKNIFRQASAIMRMIHTWSTRTSKAKQR